MGRRPSVHLTRPGIGQWPHTIHLVFAVFLQGVCANTNAQHRSGVYFQHFEIFSQAFLLCHNEYFLSSRDSRFFQTGSKPTRHY